MCTSQAEHLSSSIWKWVWHYFLPIKGGSAKCLDGLKPWDHLTLGFDPRTPEEELIPQLALWPTNTHRQARNQSIHIKN